MVKIVRIVLLAALTGLLLLACVPSAAPTGASPTIPAGVSPTVLPIQPTVTPVAPEQQVSPTAPSSALPSSLPATAAPTGTGIQVKKGPVAVEFAGVAYDPGQKQLVLNLTGNLPTPCHKLQVDVSKPDAQNRISVDVNTTVDPHVMCPQVIKPFETAYPLGALPSGSYTVLVNGKQVGQAQVP